MVGLPAYRAARRGRVESSLSWLAGWLAVRAWVWQAGLSRPEPDLSVRIEKRLFVIPKT